MEPNNKYLSVHDIANNNAYPFSLGQVRHYLTKRHLNGLQKAVRKLGKRLYLREDLLEEWIEEQGKRGGDL